jgi:pilus assembly protein CpaB
MATSRIVILGVAVAAAIGAGYLAKNIISAPAPVIVKANSDQPAVPTTEVLVLSKDVGVGEEVTNALRWQAWPAGGVDEGFITRQKAPDAIDKMKGSVARVALYTGEPLRRSKLIGAGQSFMSSLLPAGKVAVATQIAADTSAGGFILPNDYVDVIMTRRAPQATGTNGFVTETILSNIRVLAIDQTIQEDEQGRKVKVGETATLELTPEQAEIITVAQQMADRLTLALRSVKDAQEPQGNEGAYLVSGAGGGNTVRLIKSGTVSEVGTHR